MVGFDNEEATGHPDKSTVSGVVSLAETAEEMMKVRGGNNVFRQLF